MMRIRGIYILSVISFVATLSVSCGEKEILQTPVDLRFDALDSYELSASDPEPISFVVKSTSPWEVYNNHKTWCDISPASGEPGDKHTVTVQYKNNEALDDRIDTIVIKSDYWIGKWVTVTQKGTAFMTISEFTEELDEKGASGKIDVTSNQKWSSEVTSGESWLKIDNGNTGEGDGFIKFSAPENKGERRSGIISIFDRHGILMYEVVIIQKGVQLDPETMELRVLHDQTTVELKVVSNAKWTVSKDNDDAEWYRFAQTEFEGSQILVINLDKYTSTSTLRKTTFTMTTESVEGVEPVVRTITLKQAYDNVPEVRPFNNNEVSKWSLWSGKTQVDDSGVTFTEPGRLAKDNAPAGTYTFKLKPMTDDSYVQIYFIYGKDSEHEFRCHLDASTKKTAVSTRPWIKEYHQLSFDPSKDNEMTIKMSETENGFTHVEWFLNGEFIDSLETTEFDMPDVVWPTDGQILMGSSSGTVTYESYTYQAPIIWE